MLELSNEVKSQVKTATSPEVERFMQSDRSRTQQMIERAPHAAEGFSVKKILKALQDRFSHTGDIPHEIEDMIEAQVEMRTRELFRQANYDALTHLPNRAYFNATLEQLVTKAKETDGQFTLLFLDLDGFKKVNDTLGHHSGDELLRNVSARLISAVREGDIVSRLGGDEFVVLLAGLSDREMTESICERIITEVSRDYWINQTDVNISTSIGVARYPLDAKTSAELVENSDKALYVSKQSGRSTYRFYDEISVQSPSEEGSVVQRLEVAVQAGEVHACFEPQIDLASQKIIGSSVTAVWMDSSLDDPYLTGWLDALNQSRCNQSVGTWLIDSGLYYLQQWQAVNAELMVSIPMIDAILQKPNLVHFMNQRTASYHVSPSQIQLEFSLQVVMEGAYQETINALSLAGYQITVTEIGKVPLDLAHLSQISIQEIKLDGAWLQAAMISEHGQRWVKAIIQMAKALDVCVIATAVETTEQANELQEMGCLIAQGSAWSQPLDVAHFYQALMAELPVFH
ncbi:MAG: diguanylate cyclase [Gammaproteobacteria bacterium]|nr:diguanylate cyclase [Gammaproteobacteria bacterium]